MGFLTFAVGSILLSLTPSARAEGALELEIEAREAKDEERVLRLEKELEERKSSYEDGEMKD